MVLKLEHWRLTSRVSYSEKIRMFVTRSGTGDRLLHCKITKNQRTCCKGAEKLIFFLLEFLNVLYSQDVWNNPCRTVETLALTVRRSDHSARSYPSSAKTHSHSARAHKESAISHPYSSRSHPKSERSHSYSA
jgi:hypothetical protein